MKEPIEKETEEAPKDAGFLKELEEFMVSRGKLFKIVFDYRPEGIFPVLTAVDVPKE